MARFIIQEGINNKKLYHILLASKTKSCPAWKVIQHVLSLDANGTYSYMQWMHTKNLYLFIAATCLVLPTAGCVSKAEMAAQTTLAAAANRSITCQAGADCQEKWKRAGQWIKANSTYAITTDSDRLIETNGPAGLDDHLAFTVTKKPHFKATDAVISDTSDIALLTRCNDWLGCSPSQLEAKAAFADFVIGSPAVAKPVLGVKVTAVTPEMAQKMQMPEVQGLAITAISPHSLAEKSGLSEGDIIVHYDGKSVLTESTLNDLVSNTPSGRQVNMDIIRGHINQTVTVDVEVPASVKPQP